MESQPNLPNRYLIEGVRKDYLRFGVPLYEASINCDWKAAKAILYEKPELVRYSITDNGETALHVASSVNRSGKLVEKFVQNLVEMMLPADLELQNKNGNTAFYLAAAAGNVKTVTIMFEKNRDLARICGSSEGYMPMYVAAMYGNNEVVKYLYNQSDDLSDENGWRYTARGFLLQKCLEADMFDVALKIVKKYPTIGDENVLGILARKPNAIYEKKSNIIKRSINSAFALIGLRVEGYEDENEALQVLKLIWEDIARRSKWEIDNILGGLYHPVMEKQTSKKVVQALQLQNLLYKHLDKLEVETKSTLTFEEPNQAQRLQRLISEFIVNMHVETQYMNKQDDKSESRKYMELRNFISGQIIQIHNNTQRIINGEFEYAVSSLQNFIFEMITIFRHRASSIIEETSMAYMMLILAIEMGNSKFVVELIRQYPDLIWNVDDNNHTIFHHAVKHRQEDIYNLLYEIGAMKDMIISHRDAKNNNMLHLVGRISEQKRLEDVSGVALQMQRELLWFREVKNMIPPQYREEVNEDGLTPQELFTMEHKHLVTLGEKWMKVTASQCMVVATLIATIVFAAAFTIPGGYDQHNGIPIFHSKATFMVFVIADAISLFSSSASIIMFLSILTSRYAERDFLKSLPNKLMVGLATLFLSIVTMMITFSVSFFVLYRKGLLWTPILISVFAMTPVILYTVLQSGLFFDVFLSTYRSRYLFKPQKHVLYYKTPMF